MSKKLNRSYKLTAPHFHDGELLQPGDKVTLTEKQAKSLRDKLDIRDDDPIEPINPRNASGRGKAPDENTPVTDAEKEAAEEKEKEQARKAKEESDKAEADKTKGPPKV